jgi:hypothetical protein
MSVFGRRPLVTALSLGIALCGLTIYYIHWKLLDVPPPPVFADNARNDLPLQFHTVLSQKEKQHVLDGQFTILASAQAVPSFLKRAFAVVTGEPQFALANPGERYQETDVFYEPRLPSRRLVFAGASDRRWFVHYEHGGLGRYYAVVIFEFESTGRVRFIWGGVGPRAKDFDDLRKAIAEGWFCDDFSIW